MSAESCRAVPCRALPCSRAGILCLVNDADWELGGTMDHELEDGDEITFISTLHGG